MAERVQDRRSKARVDAGKLQAKVTAGEGGFEATVKNMSMSGILLTSDRHVPEMTIVGMRLSLPPNEKIGSPAYAFEISGAVVRSEASVDDANKFEVAVFLTEMTRETRSALKAFIEERTKA